MAGPDSQYHQLRHLIALRHAHPALENTGRITFVSKGDPKQALAYVRSCDTEKLLVVINPYKEAVSLAFDGILGDSICRVGDKATQIGQQISVPATSAGVYFLL